jgi:hypothetical protein
MSGEHGPPHPTLWWQVFVVALLALLVVALAALILLTRAVG